MYRDKSHHKFRGRNSEVSFSRLIIELGPRGVCNIDSANMTSPLLSSALLVRHTYILCNVVSIQ